MWIRGRLPRDVAVVGREDLIKHFKPDELAESPF
jgi:hypothetical protein